ncbi:MAG: AAA family ATPase [Myxococcales bacterium]|nr:AAA family ATPase [Myxococcales bacterium]
MIDNRAPLGAEGVRLGAKLREVARVLDERFLGRGEVVRLLLVCLVAGEHMLIVGPPGTAKSALLRHLSRLVDARFFEYLLTRFSEPSEIFGPIDIKAFREGTYVRRTEAMLPEAEIVFLDEIFKANSAILNSLLSILNERRFFVGSERRKVPLSSLFGATNEVPNDDALGALFDRFLIRAVADNLDSFHFQSLVERGIRNEIAESSGADALVRPLVHLDEIRALQGRMDAVLRFPDDFLVRYKALISQMRAEGVSISDRRVVKLLKLFVANALMDGRGTVDESDFFILKHVWNSVDQVPLLAEIVEPVLERHYREHPEARRLDVGVADLDTLLAELGAIRNLLLGGETLSDVMLFSQLRNLQDIRAALQAIDTDTARRMVSEVDNLLEGVFESSRWNG